MLDEQHIQQLSYESDRCRKSGNPKFGSALFGLLSDPSPVLSIGSVDDAKSLITQVTGEDADLSSRRSHRPILTVRVQRTDAGNLI